MTDNNHLITPPPELVERWRDEALNSFPDDENPCPCDIDEARDKYIATQAARWGADQELEACCVWASQLSYGHLRLQDELRRLRRPKPPSLKEQALAELDSLKWDANAHGLGFDAPAIRRALESLPS